MSRFNHPLLIAATVLCTTAAAMAQQTPASNGATAPAPAPVAANATPGADGTTAPMFDPAQLPSFKGQVQLYTLTPRGDIDGFILTAGTEVKTPPHLSSAIAFAVRPGDAVTVHGLKAAALPLIQASSVTADGTGRTVVDNGPPGRGPGGPGAPGAPGGPAGVGPAGPAGGPPAPPRPPRAASADQTAAPTLEGKVRLALHGPRGEVNGALLEDGTILRLPPPEAARMAQLLQPGQNIAVAGQLVVSPLGRLVEARAIGSTPDKMTPVGPREPMPLPPA